MRDFSRRGPRLSPNALPFRLLSNPAMHSSSLSVSPYIAFLDGAVGAFLSPTSPVPEQSGLPFYFGLYWNIVVLFLAS